MRLVTFLFSFFVLSAYTEYLNGKLDDGVKYAVFQRSFAEDGDYENEGIIEFKTNKDNTGLIVGIVVALVVVVAVIAAGIFFYRRRQNSASNGEDEEIGLKPRPRHRTLTDRIRGRGSGAFGELYSVHTDVRTKISIELFLKLLPLRL